MTSDNDPERYLTAANDQARRVLFETTSSTVRSAFFAILSLVLGMLSIWYWLQNQSDNLSPIIKTILQLPAWIGGASIITFPLFSTAVLFPRKLVIDGDGISYRKLGLTKKMSWKEIENIKTLSLPAWVGQAGPQLRFRMTTFVIGRSNKISWEPVFPVAPAMLAEYLKSRWRSHHKEGGIVT